ncbi:hypothetical protein [Streptomyces rimosus]|uniref:hypothetical protein n=1 Tax=Streptomyces rimosus TaxID=1927 RepID=UPI0004C61018|nr:hypothetical protein [Streptomyces rimosus]
MSVTTETCFVARCDVCGTGWGEGFTAHFATVDEAYKAVSADPAWTTDGDRIVCHLSGWINTAHQAAIDAMPGRDAFTQRFASTDTNRP